MLVELILNMVKVLLLFILNLLPKVDIKLTVGLLPWFINVLSSVAYFLPVGDFIAMFGIWLAITTFSINWRLIQRVWDALPFT